jgi:hypothetical protein
VPALGACQLQSFGQRTVTASSISYIRSHRLEPTPYSPASRMTGRAGGIGHDGVAGAFIVPVEAALDLRPSSCRPSGESTGRPGSLKARMSYTSHRRQMIPTSSKR